MEINIIGVRLKPLGPIYKYINENIKLNVGDGIIVKTERGIEYGEVAYTDKKIKASNISDDLYPIQRKITGRDLEILKENEENAIECAEQTKKLIEKLGLDMKLINVEMLFDASKVIISFTSDKRVDFRELIKELTSIYRYRIELRKIGIRDASKAIGGLGICGRELCCSNHLTNFDKVSIRMAKNQNLALNPDKINGQCGRLLCCLSYENNHYIETSKKMPKINNNLKTPDGLGICVFNNILKKEVTVKINNNDTIKFEKYSLETLLKLNNNYFNNNTNNNNINCPKKTGCPKTNKS